MNSSCRYCGHTLKTTFANLGMSPTSNDFISENRQQAMEPFYPLHAYVCDHCFLVQLIDYQKAENMFSEDYAYFSSYSDSWLTHAAEYATKTIASEKLNSNSMVLEIASNDGYLLQYFKSKGIPVLGIEPTSNTAAVALSERGIHSEVAFFGRDTAERLRNRGIQADVIAANNVLAHVPDINDFVSGYQILLKPSGVANVEFPHLLRLIEHKQFDTIYHEHYSYLSFFVTQKIFATHGMRVYDVEELSTHGGSIRLYICHNDCTSRPNTARIDLMLAAEEAAGLFDLKTYRAFNDDVLETKLSLLQFLINANRAGKSVAGYGAPAKGNTLLNYCGIKPDMVKFTVDRSPHKVGKYLPGTHIPVLAPEAIFQEKPDFILILPWNLKEEVMEQMKDIRAWGGQFVTPIPIIQVHK